MWVPVSYINSCTPTWNSTKQAFIPAIHLKPLSTWDHFTSNSQFQLFNHLESGQAEEGVKANSGLQTLMGVYFSPTGPHSSHALSAWIHLSCRCGPEALSLESSGWIPSLCPVRKHSRSSGSSRIGR